jgi:hypothetical protein
MKEISILELYQLYVDTIGRGTSHLRQEGDEQIAYNLFEEFDIGAHSFLHENSLVRLHDAGYIDDEAVALSKALRERWIAFQSKSWTFADIKTKKEWQELFELCDRLTLEFSHRPY